MEWLPQLHNTILENQKALDRLPDRVLRNRGKNTSQDKSVFITMLILPLTVYQEKPHYFGD